MLHNSLPIFMWKWARFCTTHLINWVHFLECDLHYINSGILYFQVWLEQNESLQNEKIINTLFKENYSDN